MKTEYAELISRSCFSFLRSASQPQEIIETAKRLGYQSIGLTDINGFYGIVRASEKAKELSIPLIIGCEIELTEGFPLIFLSKNFKSYKSICRLLSAGFQYQEKSKPKISLSDVFERIQPEDTHCLLPARQFPENEYLKKICAYLKPTQLVTRRFQPDADYQMKRQLERLEKSTPKAWTWDAFFHEASRFELFCALQSIRENTSLHQVLPPFNSENYLKPISFLSQYQVSQEYLNENLRIAHSCDFSVSEIKYRYPQEWLPKGKTAFVFLKELCDKGIYTRYQGHAPQKVKEQLRHELQLIQELQYEDYFLTVWDIVSFARSRKILCQGRGSAANSIVCYLLEITSIDPVQMNLLFERFISKERNEAPDIDVDFEHERREEVIQYVFQKYGRHRAGMVATLMTYRTKSAFRYLGKALDIDSSFLDKLSKSVRWREKPLENPEYLNHSDPKIKRLFRLTKQLKGFPRHLGQHTGGMIICEDRLDEISPIELARMQNRSLVQWDKYDVEKLGLLKIDILGLGMLSCLRKSFELLKSYYDIDLELYKIPHDDPKTYQMIQESRTVGVFQIESRAQMGMLPRLKPKCFYDLVVEVAIVRPGPIQGGMVHPYLRRRLGLEKVDYAHPLLQPILEKTLGIPIFQEQVMKIAIDVAGYTPGEADALRRAMGAWKKTGNLEKFAVDIENRLMKKGIEQNFAQRICKQILGFGEYGFPESHAASFALLTYASSYLKAHYPEVFLCSLLNAQPLGFYSRHALTSSFQQEGVQLLDVCLEKSQWDNSLESTEDEHKKAVRLGFRNVRGLNKAHTENFIQSREKGDANLLCFDLDERSALALATHSIDEKREAYWKSLDPSFDSLLKNQGEKKKIKFKALDPLRNALLDFEFLETSIHTHPAKILKSKNYWNYPVPPHRISLASELQERKDSENVFVFGCIETAQSPPTAKGMFFFTLQDESGFLNIVFQPHVFKKYRPLIKEQWSVLIHGKLQRTSQHHHSILVKQVISPSQRYANLAKLESKKPSFLSYRFGGR